VTQSLVRQPHLFDPQLGARLREGAIERVTSAAPVSWRIEALRAVYDLCRTRSEFTTDAVWALLDRRGVAAPTEPRAIGGVMRIASRRGWCEATDETRQSIRAECHRRPLQVWRHLGPLPAWDRLT
jgi:hypothetical protein